MRPLPTTFTGTRVGVHTLAEHVLCAVRYTAVGRVGLLPADSGVVTPPFDGRTVGVRGLDLVDVTKAGERRAPVTTVRAAAEFFGVTPGAPPLWTPTTPAEFDAHLDLDPRSVEALAAWFGLVADALAAVHPAAAQTLWPEHFDLAVTVGEAVYGGSPGDDEHAEPYLYVSPPREPVPDGDHAFWNEPFGAALTYQRVRTTSDAVAFFTEGQSRLSGTVTELGR